MTDFVRPTPVDENEIGFCRICKEGGYETRAHRLVAYSNGEDRLCIKHYMISCMIMFYQDRFNYDYQTAVLSTLKDINLMQEIVLDTTLEF